MSGAVFEVGPFLESPGYTSVSWPLNLKPKTFTGETGRGRWRLSAFYREGAGHTWQVVASVIDPEGRRTNIDFAGRYSGYDVPAALASEIRRRVAPLLAAWDASEGERNERRAALLLRRIASGERQIEAWRAELATLPRPGTPA